MTDRAAPPPLDELLARRDWVRKFARTLARDDATADDLAQDTMLAAIESPPRDASAPAGWLRRVLLHRAMNRSRGDRRRDAREAHCARRDASPSPAEVVAAAESHRRVVVAVLALEEPYRTTVLLRYFEDLPPREVAARMGVPVETVRARVRRAIERLRARLDEEHGGHRAVWLVPLLGDARGPARAPVSLAIRLIAGAVAIAIAIAVAVGMGGLDGSESSNEPAGATVADAAGATSVRQALDTSGDADRTHAGRRRSHEAADSTDVSADMAALAHALKWRPFEVRVVDTEGVPVEDVFVRVRRDGDGAFTGRTDPRGRASVEIPSAATVRALELAAPYAVGGPVAKPSSESHPPAEGLLVVERRAWVAGRVTGPDGAPVADAFVRWHGRGQTEEATDERGEFRLVVPRDVTGTLLLTGRRRGGGVAAGDELVGEVADVAAGRADVVLVAHRAGRDKRLVVRCATGDGAPLAGIVVGLVTTMRSETRVRCTTDREGRAVFENLPDWRHYAYVHEEFGAARPWEKDGWATPPGFTFVRPGGDELVLRFEAGKWVRGRVLDDAGRAVQGSLVELTLPADRRVSVRTGTEGAFAALLPADVGGTVRVRASPPLWNVAEEAGEAPDVSPPSSEFLAHWRPTPEEIALLSLLPVERDGIRPGDEGIELRLRAPAPDGR